MMSRFCASLAMVFLWCSAALAVEAPAPNDSVKKDAGTSSSVSDPTLQREVSVDAKGVKTLKLIGNDPNFDAEHAEWQRNKDAQSRAQALAIASEQRKQAEAEAKAAEAKSKASQTKKKSDASSAKSRRTVVKESNKSKRSNPPAMIGGGTVQ